MRRLILPRRALIVPSRHRQRGYLLNPFVLGTATTTPNYWNPSDKAAEVTLSNTNKTATRSTTNDGAWKAVRSITSHSSGKWYAECAKDVNGSVNGCMMFGVGAASSTLDYPGSGSLSWGAQTNNTVEIAVYHNGSPASFGGGAGVGTGNGWVAVDFDAGKIWLGDSAKGWYNAGDPGIGANPTFTFTAGTALYLMLGEFRSPQQCTLKNNSGENAGTIPTGFAMWN